MEKIKQIEELAEILNSLRSQGKKIVHCRIVVSEPAGHVDKGPHRPAFTEVLCPKAAVS